MWFKLFYKNFLKQSLLFRTFFFYSSKYVKQVWRKMEQIDIK